VKQAKTKILDVGEALALKRKGSLRVSPKGSLKLKTPVSPAQPPVSPALSLGRSPATVPVDYLPAGTSGGTGTGW
jgi:hypothetical protein